MPHTPPPSPAPGPGSGRVRGKIALVTGAASGIGRASARLLHAEGARVVLCDIERERGEEASAALGPGAAFVPLDTGESTDWEAAIAATRDRFGGLHVLVNAAGVYLRGHEHNPESETLERWRAVQRVNAEGVFLGCRHAIPLIRESADDARGGSIVNLSSVAGMLASAHAVAYGASKAAVRQLTKSVAHHCARRGYPIRCNSIHPGIIDTPMGRYSMAGAGATPEEGRQRYLRATPLGRLGAPEDIGWAVVYLASEESRFMTGAEMVIDGGVSMI